MIRISILVIALAGVSGCSKKGDSKPAVVKIDKLGVSLDVPGGVEVGDGIGEQSAMLQGSGIGAMQVEIAKAATPLAEAKSDADMYSPKNLKTEALPDGWTLTFENKGGMGTNYWVDVRRTIDGKNFKCGTTGGDASQATAVLAACKTLRKAG